MEKTDGIVILERAYNNLDDACGSLDNALMDLHDCMELIPDDIKKSIDNIDFSSLVSLKNEIEILLGKN